ADPLAGRAVRGPGRADAAPAGRADLADPPGARPDLAPDHAQPDRGGAARRPRGGHELPPRAHQARGRDRPATAAPLRERGQRRLRPTGRTTVERPARRGLARPRRHGGKALTSKHSSRLATTLVRSQSLTLVLLLMVAPAFAQAPERVRAAIGQRGNWDTLVV